MSAVRDASTQWREAWLLLPPHWRAAIARHCLTADFAVAEVTLRPSPGRLIADADLRPDCASDNPAAC